MKERQVELTVFGIFSLGTFLGGILFAFSTPPTIFDLIISVTFGITSITSAVQVILTVLEGQKADAEWQQFVIGPSAVGPNNNAGGSVLLNSLTEKKRKTTGRKNGRRKSS